MMTVVAKPEVFTPVELTITIETEQELCTLWHRLNLPVGVVNKRTDYELKYKADGSCYPLFKVVDDIVASSNLYIE